MIKYLKIGLLLMFLPFQVFAQGEINLKPGEFLYGFGGGFSFTRLHAIEAEEAKANARPFFGLSASYALSHKWRTNVGGFFAMRSTIFDNKYRFDQNGIDLHFIQQYKLDDLYFNFGLLMQSTITERTTLKNSSDFGTENRQGMYNVPNFQLMPMAGIEFKLMDNWRLFTHYSFGINDLSSNLQFGLLFRINKRNPPPESERKRRKRIARRQIRELRNGALLVRLKTSEPVIKAMRDKGYLNLAEETQKNQRIENLSLIKAFRAAYNFSEIKFFFSEDSRKIKEKKFEGIFLNDSLQKDSAIVLQAKRNYFTCELTKIERDTASYFSHYEWVTVGNFSEIQEPRFYGGTENTFYALVIKDQDYNQLSRPFPYYSRALFKSMSENSGHGIFYLIPRLIFADTPLGSVRDLNDKLFRFWRRNQDK